MGEQLCIHIFQPYPMVAIIYCLLLKLDDWLHYGFHQYCWLKNVLLYNDVWKYFSDTEKDEWYTIQICIQMFKTKNLTKLSE